MANAVQGSAERPEDIKIILDRVFEHNELKFYVNWKNQPRRRISVVCFDFVKNCKVFREYIDKITVNYTPDIAMYRAKFRNAFKEEIDRMKQENPLEFKQIVRDAEFDEFKFKTYELMHQFLMDNVDFVIQFMEMLIINEVFMTMKEQQKKFDDIAIEIQAHDPWFSVLMQNDFDWEVPKSFKYAKINIQDWMFPNEGPGCKCENDCCRSIEKCAIQCNLNLYTENDKEKVLRDVQQQNQIVECGQFCSCSLDCPSRITQVNDKMRLFEIFKTNRSGWALGSKMDIAKGAFIMECTGVLFKKITVIKNLEQSYFYHFKHNDEEYVIDASVTGNLARFINHSCEPNAHIWKIVDERNNLTSTRLAVFALRDIGNDEEITVNYDKCLVGCLNKEVKCYCGSASCRGFIYESIRAQQSAIDIEKQLEQMNVSSSPSKLNGHSEAVVGSGRNLQTNDAAPSASKSNLQSSSSTSANVSAINQGSSRFAVGTSQSDLSIVKPQIAVSQTLRKLGLPKLKKLARGSSTANTVVSAQGSSNNAGNTSSGGSLLLQYLDGSEKRSRTNQLTASARASVPNLHSLNQVSSNNAIEASASMSKMDVLSQGSFDNETGSSRYSSRSSANLTGIESSIAGTSSSNPVTLKCPDCDYQCKAPNGMKIHRLRVHNVGKVIFCSCGFVFFNRDQFRSHINLVQKKKKSNDKFMKIINRKKRELGLTKYKWIHNTELRAPKPENANYVRGYLTDYLEYLETSLKKLDDIQQKFFRERN